MDIKIPVAALAALLVCTSCHKANEPTPVAPVRHQTHAEDKVEAMQVQSEQLVKAYFAHFNNHDWEKMAAMYADVAEFKDPSLGPGIVPQTRRQIIEKYAGLAAMFPDIKDRIVNIYPSGDKHVVVEFISTGTAPDGTKFELPICTIFTIENGKITKDFTYFDNSEA